MRVRISTFTLLLILTACSASAKSIDLEMAQTRLNTAWRQPQHTIWEIEGSSVPLGGALTVESWRAGERFRFEILESPAPALVGEMLIVDGATAWQHNRFREAAPAPITTPWLSPMSDLVAMIEQRLQQPPLSATQRSRPLSSGPAQEIELRYAGGQLLMMTLDEASGLPVRVRLVNDDSTTFTLTARAFGPLIDPPAGLFQLTP